MSTATTQKLLVDLNKMENKVFSFRVPELEGFEIRYYFQDSQQKDEARIFPPHVHDRLEFYVLVEGNVSFMVENRLYRLQAGDVIVSKPNEIHNCILNADSVHKHLCFWFDGDSDFLFLDFLSHPMGEGNLISPSQAEKERLSVLYQAICDAEIAQDPHRRLYLILEILDILRKNSKQHAPVQPLPTLLLEMLDDINRNFSEITSLSYLTEKYYISPSTLNRLFQKNLHTSPKLYLESKRLAHSRILLKEGKSVTDACMESGFSDCSNYIRLFKKRFHKTPREYQTGSGIQNMDVVIK